MAAFLPETDSEDELPGEWEERATVGGSVYYANHLNSSTQWTHPRTGKRKTVSASLPFGWERMVVEDQKVVYVDNINKRTTYTDPRLAFAKEEEGSGFRQKHDASSSAGQVLHGMDLSGRTAVVTGGNSGVGLQTALALARQHCSVILACRDPARAEVAADDIRKVRLGAEVECLDLDLASLQSVRRFASQLKLRHSKLDYLVLNAGVYLTEYRLTEDGLEEMMQVNYLANFLLTQLLLPVLLRSPSPRVVTVSSESHRFSQISVSNPPSSLHFTPGPANFSPILQYNDTKLFCLLLSRGLHTQYYQAGLHSASVHPGNLLATNLQRHSLVQSLLATLARPFTKHPSQAAASLVFALVGLEELQAGAEHLYINNCFPTQPSPAASSQELSQVLWENSVQALQQILGHGWATAA